MEGITGPIEDFLGVDRRGLALGARRVGTISLLRATTI